MNKTILLLLVILQLATTPSQAQTTARPAGAQTTAILGAYGEEITLLLNAVENKKEIVIDHLHFTEGTLNGRKVVVALTGIGKVNAAITTTLVIDHFHPAEVLFSGIAGGVDPALSPGDLVIGNRLAYHDFGTLTDDSLKPDATRDPATTKKNPQYFPCNDTLVNIAENVSRHLALEKPIEGRPAPRIVTGAIVTGDVFVTSRSATRRFWQDMQAEATDMEGAAVAQTCWQQGVPFIVIRSLSDAADGEAEKDIARFYRAAAHNAAMLVIAITGELAHKR
ncbi:5'-methylthioadenosine/adenosylhomocysteine nucleosidase [Puia dinghuensis]|uniref:adenosylhomocysteine nucleosidase n=1 Tax=Puia dinghuensis TaxID=1792502 RepID=A0A8J2UB43_9BACT|nr:5'-methylthioadenosine/adenosylhomocysteine nucleosidase [Puia dinghuensis]GGA92124.1 5'-methylthioadenosine/S-adenosylhomocysteine nucleosidase [Puia dinghuensis]